MNMEAHLSVLIHLFRIIIVCKDVGLRVNLDKCVVKKINLNTGRGIENVKCNHYEVKVESTYL
jgi:hypothetical protein